MYKDSHVRQRKPVAQLAQLALAHTFAPGSYGPSVVGSLYALRAT
jgi:hypothetical protein